MAKKITKYRICGYIEIKHLTVKKHNLLITIYFLWERYVNLKNRIALFTHNQTKGPNMKQSYKIALNTILVGLLGAVTFANAQAPATPATSPTTQQNSAVKDNVKDNVKDDMAKMKTDREKLRNDKKERREEIKKVHDSKKSGDANAVATNKAAVVATNKTIKDDKAQLHADHDKLKADRAANRAVHKNKHNANKSTKK